MKFIAKHILLFTVTAALFSSCATVPVTGRSQLDIIPDSSMLATSLSQYDDFLKSHKLSADKEKTQMVKSVGSRIQHAVEAYFAQKNMSGQLKDYQWEFNLVESEEVNAWCMPGGKVVVYTGILPVTENETGLAVVMGHEIAHAVAKHGDERMSHALLTQLGGTALSTALQNQPEQTKMIWMTVYGAGAQYGFTLPYSRLHENEADHLGLIFMAMAGYDPGQAVDFWQRMASKKSGQAPPEFMSTHPSDQTRINNIKKLLPEARSYYQQH